MLVATGGLSHQVHGERAGFNNVPWDEQFLDMYEKDPQALTEMTIGQLATLGGSEGAEIVMWLIARGAMSANVRRVHRAYYLPSMTGIATAIYENEAIEPPVDVVTAHRAHMDHQLAGMERLTGTYPYTLQRSVAGYRINKFLHGLVDKPFREAFLADPERLFAEAELTERERELIRTRDWQGMIHYGVIFFMLEKLGAVIGVSNLHIYAAMRGESFEQFQATRNTNAVYSVAGDTSAKLAWNKN